MIKRLYQRMKGLSMKGWMIIGGVMGISILPCPECGTPIILHIWPIAIPILVVRVMRKRYLKKDSIDREIASGE